MNNNLILAISPKRSCLMHKKIVDGIIWGCYSLAVSAVCSGILIILDHSPQASQKDMPNLLDIPLWHIIIIITGGMIFAPLIEEFIFRFIPIRIVQRYSQNKVVLWSVIVVVSALFGKLHGDVSQIAINGSGSIILSIAFLRGGYISAVIAHMTNNTIALLLIGSLTLIQRFFFTHSA